MILFVDAGSGERPFSAVDPLEGLNALIADLGLYRDLVEIVVASPGAERLSLGRLRASLDADTAPRVIGSLWDDPPRCRLTLYEHILYWLTLRHVWRLPSWLALSASADNWPTERATQLVPIVESLAAPANQRALQAALERYYWADLWWGEEPAPDQESRRRAHALMVAWSIPRRSWPSILGTTASKFEEMLGLLLQVNAVAQWHVRGGRWFPHWVHLPLAALGMRRPIELIQSEGPDGARQVLDHVWRLHCQ